MISHAVRAVIHSLWVLHAGGLFALCALKACLSFFYTCIPANSAALTLFLVISSCHWISVLGHCHNMHQPSPWPYSLMDLLRPGWAVGCVILKLFLTKLRDPNIFLCPWKVKASWRTLFRRKIRPQPAARGLFIRFSLTGMIANRASWLARL